MMPQAASSRRARSSRSLASPYRRSLSGSGKPRALRGNRSSLHPLARASTAVPLVPPPARDLPATTFLVEVAALSDAGRAEHLARTLRWRIPETFVSPLPGAAGTYYRVRIGPFPLRNVAVARAERVSRLGYPAIIVEEPR